MKQGRSKLSARFTRYTTYERFTNETDQLFLHCSEEKEKDSTSKSSLTALEAAWNVTNAIQVEYFGFFFSSK
jgi:hypothetical protein